jgi:hypothetical protein
MRFRNGRFIFILITVLGCSSVHKLPEIYDISGKYRWDGFFELGKYLELKKDSTFTLNWQVGLLFGQTNGIWRVEGNKLILNSEIQPRKDTLGYLLNKTLSNLQSDSIVINFQDQDLNQLPLVDCQITCDGVTYNATSDFRGNVVINKSEQIKIQAAFVGMRTIVYQNTDKSYNIYTFTMLPEKDDYEYLTNKELVIKADKLFDYSIKKNKIIKTNNYIKINK